MRRAIFLALVLGACRSSSQDGPDGGRPAPGDGLGGGRLAPAEDLEGGTAAPAPLAESTGPTGSKPGAPGTEALLGSASAAAPTARPLSTSLSELGRASPLPEIEGEPTISLVVESASGGLVPDVEHATHRLRAGMRACYLRSLEEETPDASRLSLHIEVATNGSVRKARAEGALGISGGAVDCIVRRAQNATFPPPVGGPAEIVLRVAFLPPRLP